MQRIFSQAHDFSSKSVPDLSLRRSANYQSGAHYISLWTLKKIKETFAV